MKRRRSPILAILASSASLLACSTETLDGGSNANAGARLSCDNRIIESTCAEFPGGTTEAFAKGHCDGTVIEGPCPHSASAGTCTVSGDSGETTNVYYNYGPKPWTESGAREACETSFSGTFRARQ